MAKRKKKRREWAVHLRHLRIGQDVCVPLQGADGHQATVIVHTLGRLLRMKFRTRNFTRGEIHVMRIK